MTTTVVESSTTTTSTRTTSWGTEEPGAIDRRYTRGIPGLLKLLEAVSSLLAYICVQVMSGTCNLTTRNFFLFITMFCFVAAIVLFLLFLFKIPQRILRCDCVNWPLIEAVFYLALLVLLFFGDLFMSIHACVDGEKAGVFFGWVAFIIFILDAVMTFRFFITVRRGGAASGGAVAAGGADFGEQPRY